MYSNKVQLHNYLLQLITSQKKLQLLYYEMHENIAIYLLFIPFIECIPQEYSLILLESFFSFYSHMRQSFYFKWIYFYCREVLCALYI